MLACFCGSHARRFPGSQLGLEGRMEMKTVKNDDLGSLRIKMTLELVSCSSPGNTWS